MNSKSYILNSFRYNASFKRKLYILFKKLNFACNQAMDGNVVAEYCVIPKVSQNLILGKEIALGIERLQVT